MAYITKAELDLAAERIAELTELAGYRDIGTSAVLARSLCLALGISRGSLYAHLSPEFLGNGDFHALFLE